MANFIISYDLNGPIPSHQEMDKFLATLGSSRARVLETVWWLDYRGSAADLRDRLKTILRNEDSLLVCKCSEAAWQNLLVNSPGLVKAWQSAA